MNSGKICHEFEKKKNNTKIFILGDKNDFAIEDLETTILNTNNNSQDEINYQLLIQLINDCNKNIIIYSNNKQQDSIDIINNILNKLNKYKKYLNLTIFFETNNINESIKYNPKFRKIANILTDVSLIKNNYPNNNYIFKDNNYFINDSIFRIIDTNKYNDGFIQWYFNVPISAKGRLKQYDNPCCWFASAFNSIIMSDKLSNYIKTYLNDINVDEKINLYDKKYSEAIKVLLSTQLSNYHNLNSGNSKLIGHIASACSCEFNREIDSVIKDTQLLNEGDTPSKAIDSIFRNIIGENKIAYISFVNDEYTTPEEKKFFNKFIANFNYVRNNYVLPQEVLDLYIEENNDYHIILFDFPTKDYNGDFHIHKAPMKIIIKKITYVLCSGTLITYNINNLDDLHSISGVVNKNNEQYIYDPNNTIVKCKWFDQLRVINDCLKTAIETNTKTYVGFVYGGIDSLIYIKEDLINDDLKDTIEVKDKDISSMLNNFYV